MRQSRFFAGMRWVAVLVAASAASACIGSFGDKVDHAFALGGTVTGLHGTLVLQNNGGDDLTLTQDGTFTFATDVNRDSAYSVTVRTQPSAQFCAVTNGSGTMSTPVTDVAVTCIDVPTFTIGGTVSNLAGTLVLRNGTETLAVTTNGAFTFASRIASGQAYNVTIDTQPAGQTCTVVNGSGTVGGANVTNIAVGCSRFVLTYSIGGNVSGLAGTVVLRNGLETLSVSTNGAFTFATRLDSGQTYSVSVQTQPAGQTCTVANGSGTVGSSNVTDIAVSCAGGAASYSIGGTVSGLTGTVVLRNGTETLSVAANGTFTFATRLLSGQTYSVSVQTQPTGQTCAVANGSGTVGTSNVTNVAVSCATLAVSYSIGGAVSGLTGGTLRLSLAYGGSVKATINVTSNGSYDFDPTQVPEGAAYVVTIASQPTGQECTLSNASGTANATVSNVDVACTAAKFTVGGTISGLTGSGLLVEDGSSNSVSPATDATDFTLPVEFSDGADYDVGIAAQPAGQTCVITRAQGVIHTQDVTSVAINCVNNTTDPLVGTYTPRLPDKLVYLTLFADGVYVYGSIENDSHCGNSAGNGVEYGVYAYDKATGSFTIRNAVVDTNGSCGVWNNGSQFDGTLSVSGTGQATILTLTIPGEAQFDLVPVDSAPGQIYGSFVDRYHRNFWLFVAAGGNDLYFFDTQTQPDTAATSGQQAGVEYACGSITGTPTVGTLSPDFHGSCKAPAPHGDGAVDTNGTSGLSNLTAPWSFNVLGDALSSPTFNGTRITPE